MKLFDIFRFRKKKNAETEAMQPSEDVAVTPIDFDPSEIQPPDSRFTEDYQAFLVSQADDQLRKSSQEEAPSRQICIGFEMENAQDALSHMNFEIIRDYGDSAYGHDLHTWDEGKRLLAKCKNCGGYVLIQKSEFHSFTDSPDGYYTDYFPVGNEQEADMYNQRFNGFDIERDFPTKYLCQTNGRVHWSVSEA